MKMDTSPKGIANLRKMFNGIKSVPCVDTPIDIEKRTVKAADGYEIPIRIYKKAGAENVPNGIFYYIHGGGFFGGSPDVVEDEYYNDGMKQFDMTPKQKRGLSKMIGMFAGMSGGLEPILGIKDVKKREFCITLITATERVWFL